MANSAFSGPYAQRPRNRFDELLVDAVADDADDQGNDADASGAVITAPLPRVAASVETTEKKVSTGTLPHGLKAPTGPAPADARIEEGVPTPPRARQLVDIQQDPEVDAILGALSYARPIVPVGLTVAKSSTNADLAASHSSEARSLSPAVVTPPLQPLVLVTDSIVNGRPASQSADRGLATVVSTRRMAQAAAVAPIDQAAHAEQEAYGEQEAVAEDGGGEEPETHRKRTFVLFGAVLVGCAFVVLVAMHFAGFFSTMASGPSQIASSAAPSPEKPTEKPKAADIAPAQPVVAPAREATPPVDSAPAVMATATTPATTAVTSSVPSSAASAVVPARAASPPPEQAPKAPRVATPTTAHSKPGSELYQEDRK